MKDVSSHESVLSGIVFMTFMTIGFTCDPVWHEGDWERVLSWVRALRAGRSTGGAHGRVPVEEARNYQHYSPLMTGVLLLPRA